MHEFPSKFLALPAPGGSHIKPEIPTLPQMPANDSRSVVYGNDLNSSDLLLLGANRSLRGIMVEEYGIGNNFSWEFPTAFSTTSRKVIVDDGDHKYFIKEKPSYSCTPYKLGISARFQEFLSEETSFVPRIINTKSGSPYLQIGDAYFFTTDFKEGRMFNGSLQDVKAAGVALGIMHNHSQKFEFPGLQKRNATEDVLPFIDIAEGLKGADHYRWKEEAILALRTTVDKYGGQLDQDVPYVVNHGDYAPFNLVYDETGVTALNDFDNVEYRTRVRDLAGAIVSFCDGLSYAGATSTLRRPIATSFDPEKARIFVKGYLEAAPPLSDEEKADLVGEINVRWSKIMALGIMRGDFNYHDVLEALPFQAFVEQNIPAII